jgi:hypothetical protein
MPTPSHRLAPSWFCSCALRGLHGERRVIESDMLGSPSHRVGPSLRRIHGPKSPRMHGNTRTAERSWNGVRTCDTAAVTVHSQPQEDSDYESDRAPMARGSPAMTHISDERGRERTVTLRFGCAMSLQSLHALPCVEVCRVCMCRRASEATVSIDSPRR